jgi:hypothetical protein
MAGSLRIYRVAGSTLIGASPVAMFLLMKNWSNMLGWLSKCPTPSRRAHASHGERSSS